MTGAPVEPSTASDPRVDDQRRPPMLESVARWSLFVFFAVVGIGGLVWLATHDPAYPTVTTSRGSVFPLLAARQMRSTSGQWAEFDYLSPDRFDVRDDSIAEELIEVLGPVAAQRGDSVLYLVAVHRQTHLGYLWNIELKHSMRFELHGGTWFRVQSRR